MILKDTNKKFVKSYVIQRCGDEWSNNYTISKELKEKFGVVVSPVTIKSIMYRHFGTSKKQPDSNIWMSAPECAKVYGISRFYLTKLCRTGKVKARKLNRSWFIHVADADEAFGHLVEDL